MESRPAPINGASVDAAVPRRASTACATASRGTALLWIGYQSFETRTFWSECLLRAPLWVTSAYDACTNHKSLSLTFFIDIWQNSITCAGGRTCRTVARGTDARSAPEHVHPSMHHIYRYQRTEAVAFAHRKARASWASRWLTVHGATCHPCDAQSISRVACGQKRRCTTSGLPPLMRPRGHRAAVILDNFGCCTCVPVHAT